MEKRAPRHDTGTMLVIGIIGAIGILALLLASWLTSDGKPAGESLLVVTTCVSGLIGYLGSGRATQQQRGSDAPSVTADVPPGQTISATVTSEAETPKEN